MLASLTTLAACSRVDETEHCLATRGGNIISEKVPEGYAEVITKNLQCFPLTEQNYPEVDQDDSTPAEVSITNAVTRDSMIITSAKLAMTWSYVPATIPQLYREKRSVEKTLFEVQNAMADGWRAAVATVGATTMLSRAGLDTIAVQHIQRKLGSRYTVHKVFVRDIQVPKSIAEARERIIKQVADLQQAKNDSAIAVARGTAMVMKAESEAKVRQLNAQVYAQNPRVLELEIARELAKICGRSTTCVIGASPNSLLGLRGGN